MLVPKSSAPRPASIEAGLGSIEVGHELGREVLGTALMNLVLGAGDSSPGIELGTSAKVMGSFSMELALGNRDLGSGTGALGPTFVDPSSGARFSRLTSLEAGLTSMNSGQLWSIQPRPLDSSLLPDE